MPIQNTVFIFGAGASYDVIGNHTLPNYEYGNKWKPPLTKDLFKSTQEFDDLVINYPELSILTGDVRRAVQEKNMDFESYMMNVKQLSETNPLRHRQLVQMRFYLRELLNECSNKYVYTANQYGTLIARLLDIKGAAKITFVSFNYDTLLEQAMMACRLLPERHSLSMASYIHADIPLIKPHGSVQWIYKIPRDRYSPQLGWNKWLFEVLAKIEPDVSKIPIDIDVYWKSHGEMGKFDENNFYYPAIAIPLNKKTEFLLPREHLGTLKTALVEAQNIVTIGWRGAEDKFCNLMKECLADRRHNLHVVTENLQSAQEICDRLQINYLEQSSSLPRGGGFSKFLTNFDNQQLASMLS